MPHASKRKPVFRVPKRQAPRKAPGLAPVRKRQEEEWDASKLITVRRDGAEWRVLPVAPERMESGQRRPR